VLTVETCDLRTFRPATTARKDSMATDTGATAQPLAVGVIGLGYAGRTHTHAYAQIPGVRVVALAGQEPDRLAELGAQYGIPYLYHDYQDLLARDDLDAISVCTPNALHAPIAIAASQAGKHVLVEKPMALSLAEADAMIAAARAAERVLMVAHNLRYQPVYEAIKRIVADGLIGRPLAARGVFMHAGPDEFWGATSDWFWQEQAAGGGALLDMGIHMIDLLRWFIDEPVVEVEAMTARLAKPTFADDNAFVLLRFAGGAIASMQASWTARPFPDREVVIHGERGHVALGRAQGEPPALHVQDGGPETARKVDIALPAVSALVNPFVHFLRVVREGIPPLTSGEEGRATLAVTLAAYEAARSGCKVALPGVT
jgi:UDP-N-acetylglucosamine 3-dehydrogenase